MSCTGVLETCQVGECMDCGARECPHRDRMHFHHDGCPSCGGAYEDPMVEVELPVDTKSIPDVCDVMRHMLLELQDYSVHGLRLEAPSKLTLVIYQLDRTKEEIDSFVWGVYHRFVKK